MSCLHGLYNWCLHLNLVSCKLVAIGFYWNKRRYTKNIDDGFWNSYITLKSLKMYMHKQFPDLSSTKF